MDEAAAIIDRARRRAALSEMQAAYPPEDRGSDVGQLRVPPHSTEAEQGVLGALLIDGQAFGKVSDLLSPVDFFRHEHRTIFGAMSKLIAAGQPIDAITVFEELDGEVTDFGGLPYLLQLRDCVPSASNARRHAEIVAERSTLRQVIAAADEIATAAFRGDTAEAVLDTARVGIARVQERSRGGGKSRRLPVLIGPDLIASARAMRWLVKGIVPSESIGMLFGASGTFKSFIALDLACHVAHGLPWLGRRTVQGSAVWIAAEGGRGIGYRVDAWHKARGLQASKDPAKAVIGVPVGIDLGADAWRVVDAVQAACGAVPLLVVIDTLSQTYTAGASENDAADMAAYIRELGARFRDLWRCTVLLIHHTGHAATDRPRGSSVIQPNTDFLFGCFRDEKEMLATLTCEHQKDGDRFEDTTFALTKVDVDHDEQGDKVSALVARHLSSAEEVDEAMAQEAKAGRIGKNQLLLSLAQNGMREAELRKVFGDECGIDDSESRSRVYRRAKAWAIKAGFLEVAQGIVITLKRSK